MDIRPENDFLSFHLSDLLARQPVTPSKETSLKRHGRLRTESNASSASTGASQPRAVAMEAYQRSSSGSVAAPFGYASSSASSPPISHASSPTPSSSSASQERRESSETPSRYMPPRTRSSSSASFTASFSPQTASRTLYVPPLHSPRSVLVKADNDDPRSFRFTDIVDDEEDGHKVRYERRTGPCSFPFANISPVSEGRSEGAHEQDSDSQADDVGASDVGSNVSSSAIRTPELGSLFASHKPQQEHTPTIIRSSDDDRARYPDTGSTSSSHTRVRSPGSNCGSLFSPDAAAKGTEQRAFSLSFGERATTRSEAQNDESPTSARNTAALRSLNRALENAASPGSVSVQRRSSLLDRVCSDMIRSEHADIVNTDPHGRYLDAQPEPMPGAHPLQKSKGLGIDMSTSSERRSSTLSSDSSFSTASTSSSTVYSSSSSTSTSSSQDSQGSRITSAASSPPSSSYSSFPPHLSRQDSTYSEYISKPTLSKSSSGPIPTTEKVCTECTSTSSISKDSRGAVVQRTPARQTSSFCISFGTPSPKVTELTSVPESPPLSAGKKTHSFSTSFGPSRGAMQQRRVEPAQTSNRIFRIA